MKKSVEILGLPIISITEGRELGISKSLLIDAKNGAVAAITIEDDDWYRGVKLIPYESIIAIGEDAVTITHSENILTLEDAGDYERLLDENIRVIGTKAITRSGRIQGTVTEVFIGEGGKIEQCEITTPEGSINEVSAEQISIFGKQVTVVDVDGEKKNNLNEQPAFELAFEAFSEEPVQATWTPTVEEHQHELPPPEENTTSPEEQAALEQVMTPEPIEPIVSVVEEPVEVIAPIIEEPVEVVAPVIEEPVEVVAPVIEEPVEVVAPVIEEPVEVAAPVIEEPVEVVAPVIEEPVEVIAPVVEEPVEVVAPVIEEPVEVVAPVIEEPVEVVAPVVKEDTPSEEDKKIAAMTQQAEDLKAALQKARSSKQVKSLESMPMASQRKQVEKAVDERRRRVLLGKHATKTIITDSGTIIVEAGAEVTEEVLQRARLSNKFIELSMNVK